MQRREAYSSTPTKSIQTERNWLGRREKDPLALVVLLANRVEVDRDL